MNLKEAFRYQNYLDSLFQTIQLYFVDRNNVVKVKQEHLRVKANPDAENITIDATRERPFPYDNNKLIDFMLALVDEKHTLALAIGRAKASSGLDIDAEAAVNKMRQTAAKILSQVASIKPSEKKTQGSDFKFNANGEQVRYFYDVEETTTIDFDRTKARRCSKSLSEEADGISTAIDHAMIEIEVAFTPRFSVSESIDEAMEGFFDGQNYLKHAV